MARKQDSKSKYPFTLLCEVLKRKCENPSCQAMKTFTKNIRNATYLTLVTLQGLKVLTFQKKKSTK